MQYPMIAQPQYAFAPTMPMMAEGGLVAAARDVQSRGRNGDSMLVHMTPGEVGGLQALAMQHGGSLTINPDTGLPEANFLKSLLPTLLGAGLMFIPGLQGVGAGYIGAGVGAIEAARTGDIGKGLLAGLGAFGGANLAGSLMSAGTSAAASAAGAGANTAGAALTPTELAGLADPGVATQTLGATGSTLQPLTQVPSTTMAGLGSNVGEASLQALTPTQQFTTGAQNIFASGQPGEAARTAFMGEVGGGTGLAKTVGSVAAPALFQQPEFSVPGSTTEPSNYEGPYTPSERRVSYPDDERRRRSSEFTYFTPSNPVPFAEGGKIEERGAVQMPGADYVAGQMPEFNYGFKPVGIEGRSELGMTPEQLGKFAMGDALSNMTIGGPFGPLLKKAGDQLKSDTSAYMDLSGYQYDPQTQTMRKMASGGVAMLAKGGSVPMLENGGFVLTKKAIDGLGKGSNKKGQQVASAGLGAIPIKGPGTGTSDSIKTSIDGKRPARVSNGEAYVPKKQVVKHGGAKKFYALMKKAEKRA